MKRIVLLLSLFLLVGPLCMAQESALGAIGDYNAVLIEPDASVHDPEIESTEWAFLLFSSFVQDETMCDVGSALYEDDLRRLAMREHPEWPIWAIDLALDKARDSFLRELLFSE